MNRYYFFRTLLYLGIVLTPFFFNRIVWAASAEASEAQAQAVLKAQKNAEALQMFAARMRSLTHSLEGMPQPPAFQHKIQLPVMNSQAKSNQESQSYKETT